jgi:hypothetical protein
MTPDQCKDIAVVVPVNAKSGIDTVTSKLIRGLSQDGFTVRKFPVSGNNILSLIFSDLRLVNRIRGFPIIIYLGSFAWFSHLLTRGRKLLFVHGLVMDELSTTILHGSVRARLAAVLLMLDWLLIRRVDKMDAYACHSVTSLVRNKLPSQTIILPQFVFRDELREQRVMNKWRSDRVRVVAYRSHAESPRLMGFDELQQLTDLLEHKAKGRFELVVLDPHAGVRAAGRMSVIPFLPKREFLELVCSSNCYLETCTDEELRFGSLESAAMGILVAKITKPQYASREDYHEDEIISADSIAELADLLALLADTEGLIESSFSSGIRRFIESKRTWDTVKSPLLEWIADN